MPNTRQTRNSALKRAHRKLQTPMSLRQFAQTERGRKLGGAEWLARKAR